MGLKELEVAIKSQKYPTKAITLTKNDFIHQDIKMVELKRVRKVLMEKQIFKIQKAWKGGIVLKTENDQRSFRHNDSLKFQNQDRLDKDPFLMYLIKGGVEYPNTFQIIVNRECLEAIRSSDKRRIYLKFNQCDETDSQLWKAFTRDQILAELGMRPISLDGDEVNLTRFLEMAHKESFDKVINKRNS